MGWKRSAIGYTHYDDGNGALCGAEIVDLTDDPKVVITLCVGCRDISLERLGMR